MKKFLIAGMILTMMACDPKKDDPYRFDEMTYSPTETVFKVFAPDNAKCLVVVDGDSIKMEAYPQPLPKGGETEEGCIYKAVVQGDL